MHEGAQAWKFKQRKLSKNFQYTKIHIIAVSFFPSRNTPKSMSAGAWPQTPLESLQRSPRSLKLGVIHKGRPHRRGRGVTRNADNRGGGFQCKRTSAFYTTCRLYIGQEDSVTTLACKLCVQYIAQRINAGIRLPARRPTRTTTVCSVYCCSTLPSLNYPRQLALMAAMTNSYLILQELHARPWDIRPRYRHHQQSALYFRSVIALHWD